MNIEPEHHHEIHKTGHNWLDLSIALTAVFISVTSLIVAIVHSRTLERMADANARLVETNSWPFISYTTSNANDSAHSITMGFANDGVGPAKVEAVEVIWNGVAYRDAIEFLRACCGYVHAKDDGLQWSLPTGVLRAGQDVQFLTLPKKPSNMDAWTALDKARVSRALSINVCYCSVFDECWKDDIARFSLTPTRAERCEAPRTGFGIPK